MQQFAAFIVRHRVLILIVAALLLVPGFYGLRHLKIEYDLLNYLPEDLDSVRGLEVLNRDFGFSSVGMVVVKSCDEWEVLDLKGKLEQIDGVSAVFWLSDLTDVTIPRSYQQQLAEQFYREDATILQVQFNESGSSRRTRSAINEIHRTLGPGQQLIGTVVTTTEMEAQSEKEKTPMLLVSLAFLTIVLMLTLPSFATPLLFVVTLGLSVVWNLGLSYFMGGKISYITNSVAAALQLGVTMDYCIFLLHRFEEEQLTHSSIEEAMIQAVKRTLVAILASSATTVAGFATLAMMQVRIGSDLGITMARGVLVSLFATITVLPALILVCMPLIERLKHRSLLPKFDALGKMVARRHIPLFLILMVLAVPAWYGQKKLHISYDLEKSFPESLPSLKALRELREKYGIADTANIVAPASTIWKNVELERRLIKIPGIRSVSSYYGSVGVGIPEQFVPESVRHRFMSNGYCNITLTLQHRAVDPRSGEAYQQVRNELKRINDQALLTGQTVVDYDMRRLSSQDISRINWLTLLAIGLIVAVTFGSLSIPVILIAVIQIAIWLNQSVVFYSGGSLYYFAALALSTIQLGATVDYAILMTSRFREELAIHPPREALIRAVTECSGALITSGLTLCAATIGLYLMSSLTLVKDLAMLLASGAIISMVSAAVLLPAALLIFNRLIGVTTLKWPSRLRKSV